LDAGGLAQPLLDAAGLGAALGRGVVIEDVEGRFHARDGRLAGEHPWVPADEIAVAVVLHPERALIVREGWRLTPIAACGLEAAEQALFVGPNAVQILGGHGFMKDHPVEKSMRDIRTLAQMAGGRDEAELAAAALVPERELGFAGRGDRCP